MHKCLAKKVLLPDFLKYLTFFLIISSNVYVWYTHISRLCYCYKLPSNFELYTHYGQSCGKASEYKKKQEYKTSRSKTQQYHNTYPYEWGLYEHIINVPQKFNRFGCCMQHVLVSQINDLPLRYVAAEHFNGSSSVFLLRFFSDSCYICMVFCRHVFWFLFIYLSIASAHIIQRNYCVFQIRMSFNRLCVWYLFLERKTRYKEFKDIFLSY